MVRSTRARTLRRRILLFVVTALVVMGAVVGVVATRPLATELAEAQERKLQHTLDLTRLALEQFVQSARGVALQVTSRTRIRETLEEYQSGSTDLTTLRAFTEPKLRDAMMRSDVVVGIVRLDASGNVVASVGEGVPEQYARSTQGVTLTDMPGLGGDDPRFLVAAPIRTPQGEQVGTDLVLFDASPITGLLTTGDAGAAGHDSVAVFTHGKLRATALEGFTPSSASDWRWSSAGDHAQYAQADWITKTVRVAGSPWSLAIGLPKEAAYAPVRERLTGVALSVGIVLLIGIIGATLLVRPLAGSIVLRTQELESEVYAKTQEVQDELVRRAAAESNLAESNTKLRDTNAELERAVKEAQEQRHTAEQANQAKTAFLGNMSHDLRTPLQGILGFLSLLSETVETREEQKYVRYAEESAGDLLRHVDELLEISRIESGGVKIVDQEFSVRTSVQSLLETLRPEALHKSLSLSTHVTSAVPERIRSDAGRIRQIISNLLTNAIKYTHVGWVYCHVDYAPRGGERGELVISVQDTGPGIPQSKVAHIFDRFARLSYTNDPSQGAGLGLTITKTVVTMMGGTITCNSTLGEGSVFRATLPVTSRPSHRIGTAPADRQPYGDSRIETLRVVLVEDDRMNQVLLGHLLRRLGHDVTVVGNGREAIDLLQQRTCDLLFMDVQMPLMNGLDATIAIREATDQWYADIPIIGMTAYADLVEQQKFLAAGMNTCITKPVEEADLRNAIQELTREPSRHA